MRARSLAGTGLAALAIVATAAATFQASSTVNQSAIQAATIPAPSNLLVSCPNNTTTFTFAWTAPADTSKIDGYQVYYGTSSGSYPTLAVSAAAGATTATATLSGLKKNTAYYFAVRSTARTWQSVFSPEKSVTTGNSGRC